MDLAEEAAQEAFAVAAERWPRDGSPRHPVAWLVATGRNRAIGRMRRERTLEGKARLLEADQPAATMDEIDLDDSTIPDERLELIFTCCHPALGVEAQVALTLRASEDSRPRRSRAPSWSALSSDRAGGGGPRPSA